MSRGTGFTATLGVELDYVPEEERAFHCGIASRPKARSAS